MDISEGHQHFLAQARRRRPRRANDINDIICRSTIQDQAGRLGEFFPAERTFSPENAGVTYENTRRRRRKRSVAEPNARHMEERSLLQRRKKMGSPIMVGGLIGTALVAGAGTAAFLVAREEGEQGAHSGAETDEQEIVENSAGPQSDESDAETDEQESADETSTNATDEMVDSDGNTESNEAQEEEIEEAQEEEIPLVEGEGAGAGEGEGEGEIPEEDVMKTVELAIDIEFEWKVGGWFCSAFGLVALGYGGMDNFVYEGWATPPYKFEIKIYHVTNSKNFEAESDTIMIKGNWSTGEESVYLLWVENDSWQIERATWPTENFPGETFDGSVSFDTSESSLPGDVVTAADPLNLVSMISAVDLGWEWTATITPYLTPV